MPPDLAHLDRLPPKDEEGLRSLRQEPRELVHQNVLNLIRLLDLDAHPSAVHTGLDEHLLVLVSGDCERVEEDLGRAGGFNFGDIMPLGGLRGKIREGEGGCEGGADALEVGS